MKKKFVKHYRETNGVSPIIGVIIAVAITVALSTTVYLYVNAMTENRRPTKPVIIFEVNDNDNTLTVVRIDTEANWSDIRIDNGSGYFASKFGVSNTTITSGDMLYPFNGDITVKVIWIPGNTLIAQIHFDD